jgi:Family of unknown function (DUF6526)
VSDRSQSYANHVRIVPGFHYGVLGVFALNVLWSLVRLWRSPGMDSVVALLVAAALFAFLFYARTFALTVQNRVGSASCGSGSSSPCASRATTSWPTSCARPSRRGSRRARSSSGSGSGRPITSARERGEV